MTSFEAALRDATADHPLRPLRDVVQRVRATADSDRCDLCAVEIGSEHPHVVDIEDRSLRCLCPPCHLLFDDPAAARGRFRQVPDRFERLAAVDLAAADWEALQIPVGLAFFFHSSPIGRTVAFYPSPAGATESLLPLDRWEQLVSAHPALAAPEPDVEAVLVRRTGDGTDCYLVPIDTCYELVGTLRTNWVGFDGGTEAARELTGFFQRLAERAGA